MFEGLPKHHYGVIACDPPWHFKAGGDRGANRHYQTMSLPDIKAMPVADLAAPDCALFLWVTQPMLPQGLAVMAAWGFKFSTVGLTWLKLKKGAASALWLDSDMFVGLGFTTRKNTEACLLGKRGRPKRQATDVHEVIVAARREHSRKPDAAYERIQRLYPGPYLELFSREERPGFTTWGLERGKFNGGEHGVDTGGHPPTEGVAGAGAGVSPDSRDHGPANRHLPANLLPLAR